MIVIIFLVQFEILQTIFLHLSGASRFDAESAAMPALMNSPVLTQNLALNRGASL